MVNLKIIEELFTVYRNHLSGTDEDFKMLAEAFIEEMDRESLEEYIHELDDFSFKEMVKLYVIHFLKEKYKKENLLFPISFPTDKEIH